MSKTIAQYVPLTTNEIKGLIYLLQREIDKLTPLIEDGLTEELVNAITDEPLTAAERAEAYKAIKRSIETSTKIINKLKEVDTPTQENLH